MSINDAIDRGIKKCQQDLIRASKDTNGFNAMETLHRVLLAMREPELDVANCDNQYDSDANVCLDHSEDKEEGPQYRGWSGGRYHERDCECVDCREGIDGITGKKRTDPNYQCGLCGEKHDDPFKHTCVTDPIRPYKELIDGAYDIVEIWDATTPAQKQWKKRWMDKARKYGAEPSF